MNSTAPLPELQFFHRALISYLNDLVLSEAHGRREVDNHPIGQEIKKTEQRIEDLGILIERKSHED
ncbi:MAG: hypothetical protein V2A67_12185 [Bacteroidota bacterium]